MDNNIKYRLNIVIETRNVFNQVIDIQYKYAIFDFLDQAVLYLNTIQNQAESLGAEIMSRHNLYRLDPNSNINLLYSIYINNKYINQYHKYYLYKASNDIIHDDSKFTLTYQ